MTRPHRLCILIIDDNVDAAASLAALCEHLGHEVDFAYDGVAGLDAARRLRPEVVFIGLPQMDGIEVARQLRADPILRDALIIPLTGSGPVDPALVESLLRGRS